MTSWAIVAIPEDGDTTWKVSSEDVPHLTILFLGEQDDNADALHITEYLQHVVANSVNRFWLDVDRRGTLGDKEADVLFFDSPMNKSALSDLANFRSYLLQDPVIARLHGSVEQFDQWTPHLTLGYPEKPAKKLDNKFGPYGPDKIYSAYFDKIAFWVGDSEGPTFILQYKDAMTYVSDTVAHRRNHRMGLERQFLRPSDLLLRTAQGRRASKSKSNFGPALSVQHADPVDRAVARSIESMRSVSHSATSNPQHQFVKHMYENMGGRTKADIQRRIDVATRPDNDWLISIIEPASGRATVTHRLHPVVDEDGNISDYELVHDQLTADDQRLALVHYGIKGMKWGRRQASSLAGAASAAKAKVTGKLEERRQVIAKSKTLEGDAGVGSKSASTKDKAQQLADKREAKKFDTKSNLVKPKASEEAEVNNQALKRTKTHGTDMMSNKELQAMVTRMNLEQQYQNLVESDKPKSARAAGKEYAVDILKQAGQEIAVELIKGAVASGGNAAKNQATNSNSRSRTFVSTTARKARGQQQQLGPGIREILQLPPGRG